VDGWSRAWPARDADAVAALYADDAVFVSHPFREPRSPREYAAWAFADQADVDFRYGEPVVDGDRAAVAYWAVITTTSGEAETIAGVSLLRFGEDGRVVEHRDVWGSERGALALPRWAPS
jgi:ketosteroid isomerase-like protein